MIVERRSKFITRLLLLFIASSALFAGFYFYSKPSIEIKDFDKKRDLEFVQNAFKNDMYWLVENPEFSLDFLVEHMSPNKDPEYFGKLNFKVLFENNKPAGFTTYFKQKFYQGKIQFIYVNPTFRNKGYAKKLARYAAKALFDMGVSLVIITTRVHNYPAIKAYTTIGFKEVSRDNHFIDYEITKEQLK